MKGFFKQVFIVGTIFATHALAQNSSSPMDVLISIPPKNSDLHVTSPTSPEKLSITLGTLRQSFGEKGAALSISYGRDLSGGPSIIVIASKENSRSLHLQVFDHRVEIWPGSAITVTPTSKNTRCTITPVGSSKVLFAESKNASPPKDPPAQSDHQKYTYTAPTPSLRTDQVFPQPPPPPKEVPAVKIPEVVPPPPVEEKAPAPVPPPIEPPPRSPEPKIETGTPPAEPVGPTAPPDIESKDRLPSSPSSTPGKTPQPPNALELAKKELAYTNALYDQTLEMSDALQKYLQLLKNNRWSNESSPNPGELLTISSSATSTDLSSYTSTEEAVSELKRKKILIDKLSQQIAGLQKSIRSAGDTVSDPGYTMTAAVPPSQKETATKANEAFQKGDYDLAIKYYESILDSYPTCLYALSNLGVVHFTKKNLGEAEKYLRRALKNCPFDAFSGSILGIVYFQQGRKDEALQTLCRSLAIYGKNPDALNYLSLVCSELGWENVAETQLLKAIDINPKHAEAHHNLAVLYVTQNPPSPRLARRHYNIAKSLGMPPNPELEKMIQKAEQTAPVTQAK